jgi:hypothetical protein
MPAPLTLAQFQSKGGLARARKLSKRQRKAIARLGGLAKARKYPNNGQGNR